MKMNETNETRNDQFQSTGQPTDQCCDRCDHVEKIELLGERVSAIGRLTLIEIVLEGDVLYPPVDHHAFHNAFDRLIFSRSIQCSNGSVGCQVDGLDEPIEVCLIVEITKVRLQKRLEYVTTDEKARNGKDRCVRLSSI